MGGIGGRLSIVREIVRFRGIESNADEEARKGVGRGGGESPVGGDYICVVSESQEEKGRDKKRRKATQPHK